MQSKMLSERAAVAEEGGGGIKAKLAARFKRRSEDSPEKRVKAWRNSRGLAGSNKADRGAAAVRCDRGRTRCEVLATLQDQWPCFVAPNMVGCGNGS